MNGQAASTSAVDAASLQLHQSRIDVQWTHRGQRVVLSVADGQQLRVQLGGGCDSGVVELLLLLLLLLLQLVHLGGVHLSLQLGLLQLLQAGCIAGRQR